MKCSKCGTPGNGKSFYTRVNGKSKRVCKKCENKAAVERGKKKRAEAGEWYYARQNLKSRYGLSVEEYERMFLTQEGKCASCGSESENGKRLSVDHDHKTGKIRGLLCHNCNLALGNLKEDPARIISLLKYSLKWRPNEQKPG